MNSKAGKFFVLLIAIGLGIYFAWQPYRHGAPAPPAPLACTTNAECVVRGKDERERCHHVNDPLTADDVAIGAKDATSKTHDGYACICIRQTCQWASKEYQACVNSGGQYYRSVDCPQCPPNATCEACLAGCQCPAGKKLGKSNTCE